MKADPNGRQVDVIPTQGWTDASGHIHLLPSDQTEALDAEIKDKLAELGKLNPEGGVLCRERLDARLGQLSDARRRRLINILTGALTILD